MVESTFNMASNNGEPTPKRFREMQEKEPASTRYIKLDMDKYDSSVQAYSDEDLVKRVSMGLTDRRKTAKNLVDSRKN